VFMVWLGVNDVGNSYSSGNKTTLLKLIMDSYFSQLEILYVAGARIFALLNVPRECILLTSQYVASNLLSAIDKSPMMLAQSKEARTLEAEVIKQFNDLLSSRLKDFVASHGWVVDMQEPFNKALNDPTKYGSKDATCYNSDGKTCLWFNDYHPGTVSSLLVSNISRCTDIGIGYSQSYRGSSSRRLALMAFLFRGPTTCGSSNLEFTYAYSSNGPLRAEL
jgi:hypothetical protein